MRQPVAHAGDPSPRDVWPPLLCDLREILDSLADNLELPNERVLPHLVGKDDVTARTGVLLDIVDGVKDVTK